MAADRAKRALIYGMNYAPEPIGVGRYTGELGAYLVSQGIEVDVVTSVPHYPGWLTRDGYQNRYYTENFFGADVWRCPLLLRAEMRGIWRLLAPLSFAICSAPVVVWRMILHRPNVLLCVEPTLFSAPIAMLFAKLLRVRKVLHVQDLEVDAAFAMGHVKGGFVQWAAAIFERLVLSGFDQIVTISSRMEDKLVTKGVSPTRLSIVRNWVDLEKIKPLAGPSPYRGELNLPDEVFVALYAGNIGQKQGLSILLQAAKDLSAEHRLMFVIAGDGPEKRRLQAEFGNLSNVRFLPVQPEARLCELLNLADVHLLPQDQGAADLVLPSKLGGMLASGKPSIVLASPGTELFEFLGDGALLSPPGDSHALARLLERMLNDRNCLDLGDNAPRIAALDARKNLPAFRKILLNE